AELEQSKSNVSVNIRGLVEWHLVRRTRVAGSRKDHYEAATDFWRVMQEIMERRFRWNLRQVLAAAAETARALGEERGPRRTERPSSSAGSRPCAPSLPPSTRASAPSPRENPSPPRRSRTCFASAHPVQGNGADRVEPALVVGLRDPHQSSTRSSPRPTSRSSADGCVVWMEVHE